MRHNSAAQRPTLPHLRSRRFRAAKDNRRSYLPPRSVPNEALPVVRLSATNERVLELAVAKLTDELTQPFHRPLAIWRGGIDATQLWHHTLLDLVGESVSQSRI
jgi:hypothetical protein